MMFGRAAIAILIGGLLAGCALMEDPYAQPAADAVVGAAGGAFYASAIGGMAVGTGAGVGAAAVIMSRPYMDAFERRSRECQFFVNRC